MIKKMQMRMMKIITKIARQLQNNKKIIVQAIQKYNLK
jgi:hypothetical protein